jgi:hypothetical protein
MNQKKYSSGAHHWKLLLWNTYSRDLDFGAYPRETPQRGQQILAWASVSMKGNRSIKRLKKGRAAATCVCCRMNSEPGRWMDPCARVKCVDFSQTNPQEGDRSAVFHHLKDPWGNAWMKQKFFCLRPWLPDGLVAKTAHKTHGIFHIPEHHSIGFWPPQRKSEMLSIVLAAFLQQMECERIP